MNRTPQGLIEILQPGIGTTIQDRGRAGHRHEGIPLSGWLDAPLAEAANALVGNAGGEAVLELRGMGTELRITSGPVRLALAGVIAAKWSKQDDTHTPLPAWQTATLQTGDRLTLGVAETGCAYLAVAGGLQLPSLLGSQSSYWRAGFEGLQGRALRPGDSLPCHTWTGTDVSEWRSHEPWTEHAGVIRVMWGPQHDHFLPESIAAFQEQSWEATAEQDRMGLRLRGAALCHLNAAATDIVSDAVTPGAIQVPANGQPIVLLADSQTVGGYPKIATVIQADLPKLAHAKPGSRLRFQSVTGAQARQALKEQREAWMQWLATRESFLPPGFIDEKALYNCNLVSGMLRAEL
ncbi:MAG: KipI antagonist [Pseudomonadota bacterium]